VDFEVDRFAGYVSQLNPDVEIIPVSATRGDGIDHWYRWLDRTSSLQRPLGTR
jgi:hydrogenase nickel incorporation protein HypB